MASNPKPKHVVQIKRKQPQTDRIDFEIYLDGGELWMRDCGDSGESWTVGYISEDGIFVRYPGIISDYLQTDDDGCIVVD